MVSWNRCASWVTTPIAARSDSWVTDRTSWPPTRTDPERTSYTRGTSWLIVVLPAPEGPTSATSWPGAAVNETPCSTSWLGAWSSTATSSSEASDTSAAVGYENRTSWNSIERAPVGNVAASGASAISGGRSSTSKTRSNETSALITSTRTLDSAVSGPYSRDSSSASVTTVPASSRPVSANQPPSPYTRAWASVATRVSATKKVRPNMPEVPPISPTRPARSANERDSAVGRPNSFTSSAPATLNRSVIVAFIDAFSPYDSRVIVCSRAPTRRAGSTKTGSSTSDSVVICQDSENITPAVSSRPITLETTPDSVEVNACWAPITSLLSRLTSAPVWVRVKNASGIRCTWSKTRVRIPKIRPSPMRAEYHRWASDKPASTTARPAMSSASRTTTPPEPCGLVIVLTRRPASTGVATPIAALAITVTRKTESSAR